VADFDESSLGDPALAALAARVDTVPDESLSRTAARLEVTTRTGAILVEDVAHAFGSIGNPMGWPELHAKFNALLQPLLGPHAERLIDLLRGFDRPGALADAMAIIGTIQRRN